MMADELLLAEAPRAYYRKHRALLIFPESQEVLGVPEVLGKVMDGRCRLAMADVVAALGGGEASLKSAEQLCQVLRSRHLIGRHSRAKAASPDHAVLNISVTERCNLRCPHCYAGAGKSSETGGQDVRAIIDDFVQTFAENAHREIALTGGEPTLWGPIGEIVEYAGSALGNGRLTKTYLNTNATTLSPEQARSFAAASMRVAVSLDGANDETHDSIRGKGSFAATLRGLRYLRDAGVVFGLNIFVHAGNLPELEAIFDLGIHVGSSNLSAFGLLGVGRGSELRAEACSGNAPVSDRDLYAAHHAIFNRRPELAAHFEGSIFLGQLQRIRARSRTRCGVGRHPSFYVRSDGKVYPCLAMFHDAFLLGQVSEGFDRLRRHPVLAELAERDPLAAREECTLCAVRHFCGGGCPGESFQCTGGLTPSPQLCQDLSDGILELMWILAEEPAYLPPLPPIGAEFSGEPCA